MGALGQAVPCAAATFDYAQLEFSLEVPAEIRSRFASGQGVFTHSLPADTLTGGNLGFTSFLPDGITLQALAFSPGFPLILAVSGSAEWPSPISGPLSPQGGVIFHPYQAIALGGFPVLDLVADLGLPANVKIDALTRGIDGIEFSVDRYIRFQNETFSPADLLHFDGASLHRVFDAEAAGVPPGVNLDAAHRLLRGQSRGLLLLSFDVAIQANGITVEDEDLALASNDALLGLALDLDARFPDIEAGNDLNAVSVIAQYPGLISLWTRESVLEGQDAEIVVQIIRLFGSQGELSIGLSVTPGASGHPLAAIPGVDYLDPVELATWPDGETSTARQIAIPVLDNENAVGDRALTILPILPVGTEWHGQPLVVVIREDDFPMEIFRDGFEASPGAP